jgi:hypothetical protein
VTLIVTGISDLGVLQLSDSNLTMEGEPGASFGPKVFELPFCHGALGLAGSYDLPSGGMDTWMPDMIADYSNGEHQTISEFAHFLRDRLMSDSEPGETELLVHIAGYATDGNKWHPEMWFVRKFVGIDGGGSYRGRSDRFVISEDFWTRDYPEDRDRGWVESETYVRWYFNGLPEGRINFNLIHTMFWTFLRTVWNNSEWLFRRPRSIEELRDLVAHEVAVIGTLFSVSDYPAPYVGGPVQAIGVSCPSGSVRLART